MRDVADGATRSPGELARRTSAQAQFVWGRRRNRRGYVIDVGWVAFEILENGQRRWLIIARGFGRHPLLLVTNRPVDIENAAVKLARAYLKRWGVEEAGRLQKQAFDLENIRVLSWPGLVKLVWIAMWTYGLICLMRMKTRQVYEAILEACPSFGPVPRYPYYRIAGGLAWLLLVGSLSDPSLLSAIGKSG